MAGDPGEAATHVEEAERWLDYAQGHLKLAQLGVGEPAVLFQQRLLQARASIEMALRGLLALHGEAAPETKDVMELAYRTSRHVGGCPLIEVQPERTPFVTRSYGPEDVAPVAATSEEAEEEVRQSIKLAGHVLSWARTGLRKALT
ncbi:MAG TPA: HEPN domain-containing protein [Myxococcales bacterium]|nr:HEPN domain-containing protein [Myxococcales bacterium]